MEAAVAVVQDQVITKFLLFLSRIVVALCWPLLNLIYAQNIPQDSIEKKIVFLGDSLTEGYGVEISSTYTFLLQEKIKSEKLKWKVINAGISGSTTASAKGRINWILKDKNRPSLFVVILGANDGLRGLNVESVKKNIQDAIDLIKKEKIPIILGEIFVPPNYGKDYSDNFKKIFVELAKKNNIILMPFILLKIAGKPDLNLPDGIHPNEKGHQIVSEEVYTFIRPYLK